MDKKQENTKETASRFGVINMKDPPVKTSLAVPIYTKTNPHKEEKTGEQCGGEVTTQQVSPFPTIDHDPGSPPASIKSSKLLPDWNGSVTVFQGFTGTRPAQELQDAGWDKICNLLRPTKPAILSDKKLGQYIVPCLLQEGPLVGATLAIAKYKGTSTIGKMRSKGHVTKASLLIIDVDGSPDGEFAKLLEKLKTDGISLLAYSTFSHGNPQKPGMRVRLVIPLDRPLNTEEYSAAWHGFDLYYFGGQVGKADPSGANLYQQQGVWCCHPSRIKHVKSWSHDGGVVSADALIQIGRRIQPPSIPATMDTDRENEERPPTFPVSKIIVLIEWLDPDLPYPQWLSVLMAVFHATKGSLEGFEIVDAWSKKGIKYKGSREIEHKWRSFRLDISNAIKIGTLIKMAQDAGADVAPILSDDAFEVCESEEESSDESDLSVSLASSAPPALDPLTAMQQKFGLLNFNGKLCVFDRQVLGAHTAQHTASKLMLSTRSDGALLIERAVRAEYPVADAPLIVKEFFVSPQTTCYLGVEFNPKGTTEKSLNLWVGPTVNPREGLWLLIQEFLHDVICDKDWGSYLYLISFLAHALQRPEEKPGVMIIMIGGQGVGKGTVGRIFRKIWSATYVQVNNIDAVIGTFNAILERAYIVFMDEALFAGNRRGTDELKSIVTEPIVQISEKYQPSRQIRSCHRFIAATNADHFKNTERDDRRDFTLRVSESRKGDLEYWKALNDEIDNGGIEAMVYDLLAMDLSDFNVRNKPNTKELVEQKLHSLDPIQRWWHDCLYNGTISSNDNWPEFMSTSDAINGVIEVNGGRIHKKPSAITISQTLQKLCPNTRQHQMKVHLGGRHRGYLLPTLQQARAEFEKYIGGVVEWPDLECLEECASHAPLGDDSVHCAPDF